MNSPIPYKLELVDKSTLGSVKDESGNIIISPASDGSNLTDYSSNLTHIPSLTVTDLILIDPTNSNTKLINSPDTFPKLICVVLQKKYFSLVYFKDASTDPIVIYKNSPPGVILTIDKNTFNILGPSPSPSSSPSPSPSSSSGSFWQLSLICSALFAFLVLIAFIQFQGNVHSVLNPTVQVY